MIYISTDYVFDGKSPPYGVDAPTNPINKYGISKLAGEKAVMDINEGKCLSNLEYPSFQFHVLPPPHQLLPPAFVKNCRWQNSMYGTKPSKF